MTMNNSLAEVHPELVSEWSEKNKIKPTEVSIGSHTFDTLTDRHQYEVIAVFKTVVYTNSSDSFKYYEFTDAENAAEFDAYVARCKELSMYDTGVSAEYGDKLISLSTCEYSRNNGRLVVVAKKISE